MQFKKSSWVAAVFFLSTALASCNIGKAPEPTPDVNAIYTSAAQTTIAQFSAQQTQTAQAVSPTPLASPTSLATFTPLATFPVAGGSTPFTFGTPGGILTPLVTPVGSVSSSTASGCNDSAYITESEPYDKDTMKPGQDFKKCWTLENTGTCTWDDGYAFVYQGGTLDGYDVAIKKASDFVEPGTNQTFCVNLTASLEPNEYIECWKMRGDNGAYFGTYACVDIVVEK